MDILIGTRNKYKATEMVSFLEKFPEVNIHLLEKTDLNINVDEDQKTLIKNAEKKSVELSKLTDWYVLASDGGVDIPGLGKKWDILKNQRTVGEDKSDLEKANKLLSLMRGLRGEKRRATYYLALALSLRGKLLWSTEQIGDDGYIVEDLPDGEIPHSHWMGQVWYYPKYKNIFNKLTEKEKEEVRKQESGIKNSLRAKIRQILNS